MTKEKIGKATKRTEHCNVGLGGICNDRVVKESVIKGVGNVEGAPSQNPKE